MTSKRTASKTCIFIFDLENMKETLGDSLETGTSAEMIFLELFFEIILVDIHSVAKVYAVLPFYDVKCLSSGGRK